MTIQEYIAERRAMQKAHLGFSVRDDIDGWNSAWQKINADNITHMPRVLDMLERAVKAATVCTCDDASDLDYDQCPAYKFKQDLERMVNE